MSMYGNNDLNNTISKSTQTKITCIFRAIYHIHRSETTREIINPRTIFIHVQLVGSQHVVIIMRCNWFRPNEIVCWDRKPEISVMFLIDGYSFPTLLNFNIYASNFYETQISDALYDAIIW